MTDLDLTQLMQQAQELQQKMQAMQQDLDNVEVEGVAGAGMVRVVASGAQRIKRVAIEDKAFAEDHDMLQDLIAAAVNQALDKARQAAAGRMSSLMPPGMMPPGTLPGL